MHYHCEIVIPPTENIEAAVTSVMKQFDENEPEAEEEKQDWSAKNTFWDFWVIGGRWAGNKLMARYDEAKLAEFHAWLDAEKVTVSSITAGKQELSPASQQRKVDAKWNELFPSAQFVPCPLFKHSNDQYGHGLSGTLPADIMRLGDVPPALKCSRVIFAKPSYESKSKDYTGPLEAAFMLAEDAWNGCNHMPVAWDGKLTTALDSYRERLKNAREDYAAKVIPKDDWLVVTVDYHS